MNQQEIKIFLEEYEPKRNRTIVIIDFSNVEKWKESFHWKIGVQELARLVKSFSQGDQTLRRFYYGSDYGKDEKSVQMSEWSEKITTRASYNRLELVTKRVKYMPDHVAPKGYVKKCDLDVEMAVDLITLQEKYDNVVLFSGDGDLVYALRYLKINFGKVIYLFGARNNIGRELVDAKNEGVITELFFAEDFEYRLSADRFR